MNTEQAEKIVKGLVRQPYNDIFETWDDSLEKNKRPKWCKKCFTIPHRDTPEELIPATCRRSLQYNYPCFCKVMMVETSKYDIGPAFLVTFTCENCGRTKDWIEAK